MKETTTRACACCTVLDVRTTVLRDTTILVDSMTQVLRHARKFTRLFHPHPAALHSLGFCFLVSFA